MNAFAAVAEWYVQVDDWNVEEEEEEEDERPQIYVADLAAYNNGVLFGDWIDLTISTSVDEIMEEIHRILADSPEPGAEEWAIHDYEGFYSFKLDEYETITVVSKIANLIIKHGEPYAVFSANYGSPAEEEDFVDAFAGIYNTEEEFGYEVFEQSIVTVEPENMRNYFDYAAFTRDLFMSDYWSGRDSKGQLLVFRNI